MQKFEDVTPEESRKSKRTSPGATGATGAQNARRRTPDDSVEIEEVGGASGGAGSNLGAEWLNLDADEVEEQFLLSADLEKTKKDRKPREEPP